jgi:hypothetical protein
MISTETEAAYSLTIALQAPTARAGGPVPQRHRIHTSSYQRIVFLYRVVEFRHRVSKMKLNRSFCSMSPRPVFSSPADSCLGDRILAIFLERVLDFRHAVSVACYPPVRPIECFDGAQ